MPTTSISRCGGSSGGTFPALVFTIGTAGTLRAYWRFNETSGLFHDTSGYEPGTPADLIVHSNGSDNRGVAGCLAPAQDDGAWQLNVTGSTVNPGSYAVVDGSANPFVGTQSALTVVSWVRPFASAGSFRGAFFNNSGIIAGSPSYERGWDFEFVWPGGGNPNLRFVRSNDVPFGGQVYAEIAGVTPAVSYMASATFDGATIEIGLNGSTFASQADTVRGIPENNGGIFGESVSAYYYGVVDDTAMWAEKLTHAKLLQLYQAGAA